MSPERLIQLEDRRNYLENRVRFSLDELARHAGRWVAWSPDGTWIVAVSDTPEALDQLVRDAGENPERCLVEGIPADDPIVGGEALGWVWE